MGLYRGVNYAGSPSVFCGEITLVVDTAISKTRRGGCVLFPGHLLNDGKGRAPHSAIPSPSNRRFGMCVPQNYLSYPVKHAAGMALCAKPIRD
jgi:hypothetical protein